jgi:hypothetical protein
LGRGKENVHSSQIFTQKLNKIAPIPVSRRLGYVAAQLHKIRKLLFLLPKKNRTR